MIQRIEFANAPPTVAQCPKLQIQLLARALVEATRKYKQETTQTDKREEVAEA